MLMDQAMPMRTVVTHGAVARQPFEVESIKSVRTPCTVIVRSQLAKIEHSRCWLETVLENGEEFVFTRI